MLQTNSAERETEIRGSNNTPIARFDEFGRITNYHYDELNRFRPWRNPHPRQAYWEKGELIGPPFQYFKHLAYKPLQILSLI